MIIKPYFCMQWNSNWTHPIFQATSGRSGEPGFSSDKQVASARITGALVARMPRPLPIPCGDGWFFIEDVGLLSFIISYHRNGDEIHFTGHNSSEKAMTMRIMISILSILKTEIITIPITETWIWNLKWKFFKPFWCHLLKMKIKLKKIKRAYTDCIHIYIYSRCDENLEIKSCIY